MAKLPKPGLIRIFPQVTPSPSDPPGADTFYQAFGIAVVAWGRLEGLFVACLMMIIQVANDKRIGAKLPMKFERQTDIWEDAFERIPSLKSLKKEAAVFLDAFNNLSKDRNLMIHGLLEAFQLQPPLAIEALKMKAASGALVEFRRTTINIDGLMRFTAEANRLILELTKIGTVLSVMHGVPPPDAQIL